MMKEPDRFVAAMASALMNKYGLDAALMSRLKADEKLARGDTDGAAVWRRIAEEIRRRQTTEPEDTNGASKT